MEEKPGSEKIVREIRIGPTQLEGRNPNVFPLYQKEFAP